MKDLLKKATTETAVKTVKKANAAKAQKASNVEAQKAAKKVATKKATESNAIEAFNEALINEQLNQQSRSDKATLTLETAKDGDTIKDCNLAIKNSFARLKRVNNLLQSSDSYKEMLLRHFVSMQDIVAPRDIYNFDAALSYIKAAEQGTDIKECLVKFFLPFSLSLTNTPKDIAPKLGLKSSGPRWASGAALALESIGACALERSGSRIYSITLIKESAIVKMLKERAFIAKLASK